MVMPGDGESVGGCKHSNAGVTMLTVSLAEHGKSRQFRCDLRAPGGTRLEYDIVCRSDIGWNVPAPGFHPPAYSPTSTAAHVDLALASVLTFHEIMIKMRRRFYVPIAIGAFLAYSGLLEPNWLKVRTYDLTIEGLSRPITVVHIADIHARKIGFRENATIKAIGRIDPDYVFITGDLFKPSGGLATGLAFFSSIQSKSGVYFVPGNGDEIATKAIEHGQMPASFSEWRILMNESVDCGDFTLVGIDDPVRCRDDEAKAFRNVTDAKPVFVLTHFYAKKLLTKIGEERRVDFTFSSHTHGGQIGFGPIVRRIPYAHRSKYIAGLYRLDGGYLYVTRGVGVNLFPLRFFCRPEIAVFHLRGG